MTHTGCKLGNSRRVQVVAGAIAVGLSRLGVGIG